MNYKAGDKFVFRAAIHNSAPKFANYKPVTIVKNGNPIIAGDLIAGKSYLVDIETGELEYFDNPANQDS